MTPPFIEDRDGHDLEALRLRHREWLWQMDCIDELLTAKAEGRKLSFRVPSFHDEGATT
jgi:hypothetical protein